MNTKNGSMRRQRDVSWVNEISIDVDNVMYLIKDLIHPVDYSQMEANNFHYSLNDSIRVKCPKCGNFRDVTFYTIRSGKAKICLSCYSASVGRKERQSATSTNNLLITNPELIEEWDYERNIISPEQVTNGSGIIVWWKCKKCHSWKKDIYSRVRSSSCPYCCNQLVLKGYNDFATTNPELIDSWDVEKNSISPTEITAGSGKSIWWKCDKGHSWKTAISNRKKQKQCPYCSGRKILPGFNDLATLFPELISEWDFVANTLDPSKTAPRITKKAFWICSHGHHYSATISSRTNGTGCPICANQKVLKGVNDLATTNPELLREWDWEKNIEITPYSVVAGSERRAWWKCSRCGNSWETMINTRLYGSSCPVCAKEYKTSFPEQAIHFYLKSIYDDCISGYKADWLGDSEIDVYIPSRNIGIEYDGRAWHTSYEKDCAKNELCAKHGIHIFRLREPGIAALNPCVMLRTVKHADLTLGIKELFLLLNIDFDVDVERDKLLIYELMEISDKKKSLYSEFPAIAAEWDYKKNAPLTPQKVTFKSGKSVYWICSLGHSYKTDIDKRTVQNVVCPYCANKKILVGYNDLETVCPEIAREWDYEMNNPLVPSQILSGSNKKVWWRCERGHSYQAKVSHRVGLKSACPYCAGHVAISGENDFKTKHPDIADYWNYDLNPNKKPELYLPNSHEVVNWKCKNCGNTWKISIKSMVARKYKCKICRK